jgi:hypothetical protein
MFVGRNKEMTILENLYAENKFQMVVVYGRRRVGKTTLLKHFTHGKRSLFFVAQEASDVLNLDLFSRQLYACFGMSEDIGSFKDWDAAFRFLAFQSKDEPLVIVIDEFPYAAEANKSLKSILQNHIDHYFLQSKLFLVLCGSHMSFMEHDVMGYKSPLYGRRTAQLRIEPFDFYDAIKMIPEFASEDKVMIYGAFGGTPHYLAQINPVKNLRGNLISLFFDISGYLYDEPMKLLQQELREPALYNTIITMIATGSSKINEIATRSHEERSKVSKYLTTLIDLHIIQKEIPFGDDPLRSRKGIYKLADPCYSFWYRFVFNNRSAIEQGLGNLIFDQRIWPEINTYIGFVFEQICRQYLQRQNLLEKLPLLFTEIGRYWGTNPKTKAQIEIDIVAKDDFNKRILYGECKWRNDFSETKTLTALIENSLVIHPEGYAAYYILFSKVPFSEQFKSTHGKGDNVLLVSLDQLVEKTE